MNREKTHTKDDGRTIADMSSLERPALWIPRFKSHRAPQEGSTQPPTEAPLTKEERRWCILGTLKAALLIAGAYIAGLGIVVLLFLLL